MAHLNGHALRSTPASRPATPTRSTVEADLQKLEGALRLDPRSVAAHNRVAEYCMTQRLYAKAYQFFQSSYREDGSQLLPILKMALIKFELALEASFAADPSVREDIVSNHLQHTTRHLKEFKMRLDTSTNEATRRKQSHLLGFHALLSADALLAQSDRFLFNNLSTVTEEPILEETLDDLPCTAYENALQEALELVPAFFALHHRLLSYLVHFGLHSRVISHLVSFNTPSTGLMTNLEWSRWGALFLDAYFASLTDDSDNATTLSEADSESKKAPIDFLQLIVLRLQFKQQVSNIILSNPAFNNPETLNLHKSDFDKCLSESAMLMDTSSTENDEEDEQGKDALACLSPDWSLWRSELDAVSQSLQFRHSLRVASLNESNRNTQWTLVQQGWNHFWNSCNDECFQSLLRWSLNDADWRSKTPIAQTNRADQTNGASSSQSHIDFNLPTTKERLLRLSSDLKLAHLLISASSPSSPAANVQISKAFYVARISMDSFELPPWASSQKLLTLALKADMLLLSHSDLAHNFDAVQSLFAFYFEINCAEALFTIFSYVSVAKEVERKQQGLAQSRISVVDLFTYIYLTGIENTGSRVVSWSSPLAPLTELINQPPLNVCSLNPALLSGLWLEICNDLNGATSNVSGLLKAFLGQDSSSASTPLSTPHKSGSLGGSRPSTEGKGILTPKILRGGFGMPSPFRPQSPFSMASTKAAASAQAAIESLLSTIDTTSVFATTVGALRKIWLGIFGDAFTSLPPSALTQLPKPLTTMLLIFSWAAHRYRTPTMPTSQESTSASSSSASSADDAHEFEGIQHPFQHTIGFGSNPQVAAVCEKAALLLITLLVSIFNQAQAIPVAALELVSSASALKHSPEALLIAGELFGTAKEKGIVSSPSLDLKSATLLLGSIVRSLEKLYVQHQQSGKSQAADLPKFPADFEDRFHRLKSSSNTSSIAVEVSNEDRTSLLAAKGPSGTLSAAPTSFLTPKADKQSSLAPQASAPSPSPSPMKFGAIPSLGSSISGDSASPAQASVSALQQGYSSRLQKLRQKMTEKKAEKHGTPGAELEYLKPFTSNFSVPTVASIAAPAPLIVPEAREIPTTISPAPHAATVATTVAPAAEKPTPTFGFGSKPSTPGFGFSSKPTTPPTFAAPTTSSPFATTTTQAPAAPDAISTPASTAAESALLAAQLKAVKDEADRLTAQKAARDAEDKAREAEFQRMKAFMDAEKAAMAAMKAELDKQRLETAQWMEQQKQALQSQILAEQSKLASEMSKVALEQASLEGQRDTLEKARLKLEEEKKHEMEEKKRRQEEMARFKAEHEAALRAAELERMEDEAVARQQEKDEQNRLEAERLAKIEEDRLAEETRLAAEAARLAEEKKANEEADRIASEKKAEEDRLEAERLAKIEEDRLAEEALIAEEARLAEEKKAKEEVDRIASEKKAEEDRLEAERLAKIEEDRLVEEVRIATEEARIAAERKAEEDRIATEKAEEADRLAKIEEERLAEEVRLAEEARLADEKKAKEEADRIAAEKKAEEERLEAERLAKIEEDRLAEEARVAAEEARLAEEKKAKEEADRIASEQKAEEDRLEAERLAKIEEDRLAEEALIAEEARLAEEKKSKEETDRIAAEKKVEEDRLEAERLAKIEEEKAAEEARVAEAARVEDERRAKEEADRLAAEKAEDDRLEAERLAKIESDRLAEEARVAAEEARIAEEKKAEEGRIAAEKAEEDRLEAERVDKLVKDHLAEETRLAAEEARLAEEKEAEEEADRIAKQKADEDALEAESKKSLEELAAAPASTPPSQDVSTASSVEQDHGESNPASRSPHEAQAKTVSAHSEVLQNALEAVPSFDSDDDFDEDKSSDEGDVEDKAVEEATQEKEEKSIESAESSPSEAKPIAVAPSDTPKEEEITTKPSEEQKPAEAEPSTPTTATTTIGDPSVAPSSEASLDSRESDQEDTEDEDEEGLGPISARSRRSLRDSKEVPPSPKGPIAAFSTSALDDDDDEDDLSAFDEQDDHDSAQTSEEEIDPRTSLRGAFGMSPLNEDDEIHTDSEGSDASDDLPASAPQSPMSKETREDLRSALQAGFDDDDDFGTDE